MMGVIIALCVVFLLTKILPAPGSEYTGKKEKTWCPPHEWVYGDDGFLICKVCNNKPGYNPRE